MTAALISCALLGASWLALRMQEEGRRIDSMIASVLDEEEL